MDWQPIDTAPKDSSKILGFLGDGDDFYGAGEIEIIEWGDHYEYGSGWLISREEQFAAWCNPTHWMPLPTPPLER